MALHDLPFVKSSKLKIIICSLKTLSLSKHIIQNTAQSGNKSLRLINQHALNNSALPYRFNPIVNIIILNRLVRHRKSF